MMTGRPVKILLLGASGMLGGYFAQVLPAYFTISSPLPRIGGSLDYPGVEWLSHRIDCSSQQSLDQLLQQSSPDLILNCIGVTPSANLALDLAENIRVNSLFPHLLAASAAKLRCKLIHFSTDAVFSGARGNYTESDLPDPADIYGRSKLLGELDANDCLTLRTTFYGLACGKKGLINWLLTKRGACVPGYVNYIFSGISLQALVEEIRAIIALPAFPSGVYHLGGPRISKYALLKMLIEKLDLKITVEPALTPVVDRSLDSSRFWKMLGHEMPQTAAMLDTISRDFARHPS
ncbi:MAG TPA: sugar nucleotide-binding protein [Methylobacter sp.]